MKIALTTHGTRGDVQPFVSLALALMERGHEVTLGAPPNLTGFVERCGVRASKIAIDSQAFLESERGRAWLAAGDVSGFMKEMSAVMRLHRDELIEDQLRVSEGAEVLVAGVLTEDYASVLAEARRLPMLAVHFSPLRTNGAYANPLVTVRSLPSPLNRLTHHVLDRVWWAGYRDDINAFRRRLSLPSTGRSTARRFADLGARTVHAFSPALVPPPREYAEAMPVVGSIHFPDAARSKLGESARDEGLAAWLGAGPAPVFFGLGSMPVEDPAATLRMVADVTKACGARALVGAGWSRFEGSAELPAHVRVVGAVDHGWLFPQCAAAVHHGGAGTVFAALRAGLPTVVASVFADQPFWGTRLERLGVGVHLPFRDLRAASLERSLRRVLAPGVRESARRLGDVLRAEPDATPGIVARIEALGARPGS